MDDRTCDQIYKAVQELPKAIVALLGEDTKVVVSFSYAQDKDWATGVVSANVSVVEVLGALESCKKGLDAGEMMGEDTGKNDPPWKTSWDK